MEKLALVFVGGGLGAVARYLVSTALIPRVAGTFPLGTFIVNVTGSFLIGFAMALLTERFQADPRWRLFLVVGILGGYTTFSSFEYETYQSFKHGYNTIALLYVLSSVVAGYAALLLGTALAAKR